MKHIVVDSGYVEYVYELVKMESAELDAIYEDFITHLVGNYGLLALRDHKLIEACGIVNGRQLYVLCPKPNN